MAKKTMLLQGILDAEQAIKDKEELERLQLEQEEADRIQMKLKQEEQARLESERLRQEEIRKEAELLLQQAKTTAAPRVKERKGVIGSFFSFIGRMITMCFNLMITLLEQLQWIVVTIVLAVATYIVLNYYNLDIGLIIEGFLK